MSGDPGGNISPYLRELLPGPARASTVTERILKCGTCGEDMSPLTYRERPHPTDQIYRCMGSKRHSHTYDTNAAYRSDIDSASVECG
jgi:hypothetical protein